MRAVLLPILLLMTAHTWAGEGAAPPWEEFKALYTEHVARQVRDDACVESEPAVYSLDETEYTLFPGADSVEGEVVVRGRRISGEVKPIPLFGPGLVLAEIGEVDGGALVAAPNSGGIMLLPAEDAGAMQVRARFLARPAQGDGGLTVAIPGPRAAVNTLTLTLPANARLVEAPGIQDERGVWHFAADDALTVRYVERQVGAVPAAPELDTLTRIVVQDKRVLLGTFLLPVRTPPESLDLRVPRGCHYVATSLRPNQIERVDDGLFQLHPARDEQAPFAFEVALDLPENGAPLSFELPAVEGNTGSQGRFVLIEPDDGQVSATASGLVDRIPAARLDEALAGFVPDCRYFASLPSDESITLDVRRFQTQSAALTVLGTQSLYVSIDDTGRSLSVLTLDLPSEVGPRLVLKPVVGGEIWSLTVNDTARSVFTDEDGHWIIPLDSGQTSHVALSVLHKGPPLGLQGKLEVSVPETGLPSQELRVGLGLPARIEVQSVEGPVSTAKEPDWLLPPDFVGKRYFFSQAFYKGEGLTLAVSYKEPVNPAP